MDIDSPPTDTYTNDGTSHSHSHITLPSLSASFPLPFRVLFLIGLAQLLWAVNLHVLYLLGLDTAWILDFREEESLDANPATTGLELDVLEPETPTRPHSRPPALPRPASSSLYGPVYKLFGLYTLWCGSGWAVFRLVTGGEGENMEEWRWLIGVISVGAALGVVVPWKGVGERERRALMSAVKRIVMPPIHSPVFFSDVILADILTSFAKVLGDLWISSCQIWSGGITHGRVAQPGWPTWVVLGMVCLPYLLRFRQCLLEYYQSSWTSPRPLANALKYLSALPVIFLSAAQKSVVSEIAFQKGISVQELGDTGDRWFGEHLLFRLWLLAVVVNSMFSFYWDISMDWGLALCEVDTWLGSPPSPTGQGLLTSPRAGLRVGSEENIWYKLKRLVRYGPAVHHQRSPHPSFSPIMNGAETAALPTVKRFTSWGLRPTLLLPDPLVYHLFALVDLVLRFTWSLKLSSHLHTISEIESGVFMMEALELMRRWGWVFIRVEWEAVKKGEVARFSQRNGARQTVWAEGEASEE
ncbi:hypothetical protein P7C73_g5143, partial [Tremellales sp. Uapishka_1]